MTALLRPISNEQIKCLTQWFLPLPKELMFMGSVHTSITELRVCADEDAGELIRCAAEELNAMLGAKQPEEGFRVYIGTRSSKGLKGITGIPDLDSLKNADQAYAIVPIPGLKPDEVRGVALIGRTGTGAYYAVKTFMQLLEGAISCAKSKAEIELPVICVRDWPDLAERGLWGGSANEDIEWLAERKMNLVESHANLSVNADGHGVASIPEGLLERARRHAIKLVPIIMHLEQLPGEIFSRFPMLKGMGDEAAWRKIGKVTPACFSQPKLQEILADWLTCLARYSEVTDINVWLSENVVQCACDTCKAMNQFVLETRTVLRAWEAARRVKPDLRLRLLLTQGSYASNDKVLAAVPKDVGITYYHGGKTYTCDRDPMIYPLLEKYAADGGWLGCYPTLTPSWAVLCPWSAPQFIKDRMTEFVNKKLTCLCGFATPSNRFYEFNLSAAAEWSWNSAGRNEREFALAWATREKLSKPEKAADWAVTLGPRGQDVYGSQVPYSWFFGTAVADRLPEGLPPLGDELFRYLESAKKIEDNLAACGRAMALAREVNAPALIYETQTITGYMQMLKGLHQLSHVIAKKKTLNAQETRAATEAMKTVAAASNAVVDGLERWQKTVAPKFTNEGVAHTVQVTKQTAADVAAVLAKLTVKPAHKNTKDRGG